ncbi:hypothetical protein HS7_13870 [Sulfolobales archaeon HS-7]|nr:hypothetical protein HS7_13870 [Sulfolobales archaeon HS-7]
MDSFPVELPHGEKIVETHIENLVLDLREIDPRKKPHEVLASLDERKRKKLFSHFPGNYTIVNTRVAGEEVGEKPVRGEVLRRDLLKTLMVCKVKIVPAKVSTLSLLSAT